MFLFCFVLLVNGITNSYSCSFFVWMKLYEKIISVMYLGEIVIRVLLHMCQTSDLFGQSVPAKLATPLTLKYFHLSHYLSPSKHISI